MPAVHHMNPTHSARVVIFANGLVPDPDGIRALLREEDVVFCADGGTRLALVLDVMPQVVIGDLDSIAGADRARIESAGIPLREYPHDKDETDLELALQYALERKPEALLVVGALGGRLDHTVANMGMLSDSRLEGIDCRLDDGLEQVMLCRRHTRVDGRADDLVSLIPWGNPVTGVRTEGLRWPLNNETLYPHKTRGVSNEMLAETAEISIAGGLLLIIHTRRS